MRIPLNWVGCALGTTLLSCTSFPATPVYVPEGPVATAVAGSPSANAKSASENVRLPVGYTFCRDLAVSANSLSTNQAGGGWTLSILGLVLVGNGAVLGAINVKDGSFGEKASEGMRIASVVTTVVAGLIVPAAYGLFSRSDAATKLAAAANLAMTQNDRKAYELCVAAKADWQTSRTDANAFAINALKDPPAPPTPSGTATASAQSTTSGTAAASASPTTTATATASSGTSNAGAAPTQSGKAGSARQTKGGPTGNPQ